MKLRAIILKNELPDDHIYWLKACEAFSDSIIYQIVDLTKNDWLEQINNKKFDVLLAMPSGLCNRFKQLYDERIYILQKILGFRIFPSAEEIFINENKRFLSFWLDANKLPHPRTWVFYHQNEAFEFLYNTAYPVVAKTNLGASGKGVVIIKNLKEALKYTKETFSGRGASQRIGPNLKTAGLLKRGFNYLLNPSKIKDKLFIYKNRAAGIQIGFVIFQEFIPHDFEWRVVRIGDSFFAHKKLKQGEKASGSLIKGYENPPLILFDFVKEITDKHKFFSQAIDIFETPKGLVINEMQCVFGQSDPFQMLINGKSGRYIFINNSWQFEAGDFNRNKSFNLRVKYLIDNFSTT